MQYFKVTIKGHQQHVNKLNVEGAEWDKNRILGFVNIHSNEFSDPTNFEGVPFDLNEEYQMCIEPIK